MDVVTLYIYLFDCDIVFLSAQAVYIVTHKYFDLSFQDFVSVFGTKYDMIFT